MRVPPIQRLSQQDILRYVDRWNRKERMPGEAKLPRVWNPRLEHNSSIWDLRINNSFSFYYVMQTNTPGLVNWGHLGPNGAIQETSLSLYRLP